MKIKNWKLNNLLKIGNYFETPRGGLGGIMRVLRKIILPTKNLSKRNKKILAIFSLAAIAIMVPIITYSLLHLRGAEAAWFNDNWGFRKAIPVTSTNGSAQSNVFISFTLDTTTLISNGKLQSNCQDIRVADIKGNLLKYHVGRTNACNNASTAIDVLIPSFPNGQSTYYVYYGNPSAPNADAGMYLSNIITGSGNEITDATRFAGLSGDFRTVPDSSFGIWESRTNLLKNSGQLNQGTWGRTGTTVNPDTIAAPNGTTTADKVIDDVSTGAHVIAATGLAASGTNITASIFAKAGERIKMSIAGNNNPGIKFDLSNGTIISGTNGTITPIGNGWYRLTANFNTGGGQGAYYILLDASGNPSYTGDGASGLYLWGGQVEVNTTVSPYIPTTSVSATRNAGRVQTPSSLLNATQGWIAIRARMGWSSATVPNAGPRFFSWSDGTTGNRIDAYAGSTTYLNRAAGGTNTPVSTATTFNAGDIKTFIFAWTSTTLYVSVDGSTFTSTGNALIPTGLQANFDIGTFTNYTAGREINSDILWTVGGTGTLTNTDASNINSFGNTDPTPNSGFGSNANMTFVWNANYLEALNYTIGTLATEEVGAAPVAYWKFDEGTGTVANDSSSNRNNGTITGATWQTEDQCTSGKCLFFNGNSANVGLNASSNANIIGDITVSVWIKPKNPASDGVIIHKENQYTLLMWADKRISWADSSNWSYANFGSHNIGIESNKWNYITVTKTNGTVKIYLNGVEKLSQSFGSSITSTGNKMRIGCYAGASACSSYYFAGFIDEPKIYSYARTATQIKTDYSSRESVKGVSAQIGASTANQNLSNGLVGYWKMDEASGNAIDSSGNGLIATAYNTPTFTSGKFGNSASLTAASSQYFNVGDPASGILDFGTSNFSMATWIKTTATGYQRIISKGNSGFTNGYLLQIYTGTGYISTGIGAGGSQANSIFFYSSNAVNDGNWHHVITIFDQTTKKAQIFIDGQPSNLTKFPGTCGTVVNSNMLDFSACTSLAVSSTSNFNLGRYDAGGEYYNGQMDEVRVYNRALSPAEVQQLYNYALGPIGYWNFEEGSGGSVNDTSGNNNQGTWYGTGTTHWTQGKYGKGVNFNGSDDRIPTTTTVGDNTYALTAEAWIYSTNGGYALSWLAKDDMTNRGWYFGMNDSTSFKVGLWTDSGRTDVSMGGFQLNRWTHVAFTYDGANIVMYRDGIASTPTAKTGKILSASSYLTIGSIGTGGYYFQGKVDEARIYNYARTAKQIVSDMNAGHPNVGSPVGSALGYWKFDEGYGANTNNSGNGGQALKGILSGITTPSWTNNGKFGKALSFDGTNSYVNAGNSSSLDVGASDFTASAWIYPTTTNGKFFLQKSDLNDGWLVGLNYGGSNRIYLEVRENGTTNSTSLVYNTAIQANTWYYVTVVKIGASITVYKNGVSLGTQTAYQNLSNSSVNFQIGRVDWWGPGYFQGLIDEVKLYNYALTADEIKLDYNHGATQVLGSMSDTSGLSGGSVASNSASAAYCIPGDTSACSSPVGEWNFEEGNGNTVNDISGNGNMGTWNGTLGSQWTQGKYGKAGNFNGTNNYVLSSNLNSYLNNSNPLTIEVWFYPTAAGVILSELGQTSIGTGWHDSWIEVTASNGTTKARVWNCTAITLGTAKMNTWNHAVLTYTSGTLGGYLNSAAATGGSCTRTAPGGGAMYFALGATDSTNIGSGNYFSGRIDQVRMFNYARTPAQVAYDYNRGAPVGYWKFDECQGTTINDSSGNGNRGTITIGATGSQTTAGTCLTPTDGTGAWYNGASGKFNASLKFDGTDDFVSITDNNALKAGLTISTWYKASSTVTYNTMFNRGGQGDANGFVWFFFDNSTKDRLWYQEGNAGYCSLKSNAGTWSADGQWHNLVASHNSTTNYITFYKDGEAIGGGSCTWRDIANSTEYIGTYNGSSSTTYTITGQLDDFRLYNYALTASQVKQVMNQGAGVRFGPLTGLP